MFPALAAVNRSNMRPALSFRLTDLMRSGSKNCASRTGKEKGSREVSGRWDIPDEGTNNCYAFNTNANNIDSGIGD